MATLAEAAKDFLAQKRLAVVGVSFLGEKIFRDFGKRCHDGTVTGRFSASSLRAPPGHRYHTKQKGGRGELIFSEFLQELAEDKPRINLPVLEPPMHLARQNHNRRKSNGL